VGKVSDVVPSSETSDRFRVEISEYAIVNGPHIELNSASPTQYFPSLSSIGIDEASLQWKPIRSLPDEDGSIPRGSLSPAENALQDVSDGGGIPAVSVIMQAKKLVADGLRVPLSSVEIIIRA
jgi:hypothetical protein